MAPSTGKRKRKAASLSYADSSRKPLKDIPVADAQNKRRRVFHCVLILNPHRQYTTAAQQRADLDGRHIEPSQTKLKPSGKKQTAPPLSAGPASTACEGSEATSRYEFTEAAPRLSEDDDHESAANASSDRRRTLRLPRPGQSYAAMSDEEGDVEDETVKRPKRDQASARKSREESDYGSDVASSESEPEETASAINSAESSLAPSEDDDSNQYEARKPRTKTSKITAKPSTSKSQPRATAAQMKKLLFRPARSTKGLDPSLPPLSKIDEVFEDLTGKAIGLGLANALDHLQGCPLRVATMCSGTESPILALQMIQNALKTQGAGRLEIEHLFSAEIVPFKQAYIERNFKPPILFRDITELTDSMGDETPVATTAYGSKVPVPKNVHLLIAGTSCVDFSKLNSKKKDLGDGGESGQTWHACLAYCKAARPAIVILENVKGAPWDTMISQYQDIGYETGGVLVDTKDFYLPQTRQRGYLVCFDKSFGAAPDAGSKWEQLMGDFRRHASSPFSSFLLPGGGLYKEQTRGDDVVKSPVDWARCEVTQLDYRHDMHLGMARPYTHWEESGRVSVPEIGPKSWYRNQVDRVLDTLDAAYLRKALPTNGGYDVRYKTRLWDVSQNIYRNEDVGAFGIAGCLTPSGHYFISDKARPTLPEENLKLQGIPLGRISFTTETQTEKQDLAGNAMSSTVVGSATLAALIVGHTLLSQDCQVAAASDEDDEPNYAVEFLNCPMQKVHLRSGQENLDLHHLLQQAAKATRRCFCEGQHGMADNIEQCVDCNHTACFACSGNPLHNYRRRLEGSTGRLAFPKFEQDLRSSLPLRIEVGAVDGLKGLAAKSKKGTANVVKYLNQVNDAVVNIYDLSHIRRTHNITVTYVAQDSRLELVLDGHQAEWRLFVNSPKSLASDHWMRQALAQPVAKLTVHRELFGEPWEWRIPEPVSMPISIKGHGTKVPAWRARMEMPDFRESTQWEYLTIGTGSKPSSVLQRAVHGTYKYLPQCGTACESLYKKVGGNGDEPPLYLFLDPTAIGPADQDTFVFSTDKEKLEYDEIRLPVAYVQSSWRAFDQEQDCTIAKLMTDHIWETLPLDGLLRPLKFSVDLQRPAQIKSVCTKTHCHQVVPIVSSTISLVHSNNQPLGIAPAWAFEAMRRHLLSDEWHTLDSANASASCDDCAPPKPRLRWKLSDESSIVPYEDPAAAAIYERSIKRGPLPVVVRVDGQTDDKNVIEVGANLMSLAHKARARLPAGSDHITFKWKLSTTASSPKYKPQTFHLRSASDVEPYTGNLGMSVNLFPKQRLALAWMLEQESGLGQQVTLEESEEAAFPDVDWTIEMRAQTTLNVRGGICADHAGFGKTVTSLALIQAQFKHDNAASIMNDLEARQKGRADGLLPTLATLIVCPRSLTQQWTEEISKKLGYERNVIVINTAADLAKRSMKDFQSAKIVVVSRSLFSSDAYAERLAAFAGMPEPIANRPRAYGQWLDSAASKVPEHLRILQAHGLGELRRHLQEKYKSQIDSEQFKAVIPSRRLRGKELAAASTGSRRTLSSSKHPKAAATLRNTDTIGSPLLEMFYFNRLILDEFHDYEAKECVALTALHADKRWGLSATPALRDFYDIAHMAGLLNVPLRIGSDARGVMNGENISKFRKGMTGGEKFDAMRQMPSDKVHARIHEIDQAFLDQFVRRNIEEFADIPLEDHLLPVTLDLDHRAVYAELSQQLNSADMRIKKSSKSKTTDRDVRYLTAVEECETAEEALSKAAAAPNRSDVSGNARQSGLERLANRRDEQSAEFLQNLRSAIRSAKSKLATAFEKWRRSRLSEDMLGDRDTTEELRLICDDPGCAIRTAGASRAVFDSNDDRGSIAEISKWVSALVVSRRSARFLRNVQSAQQASQRATSSLCECSDCSSSPNSKIDIAISAFCGHSICRPCYNNLRERHAVTCPADGCSAPHREHHFMWSHKLDASSNQRSTPHGAKIDAAMRLLKEIKRKGDQAILFVQYPPQLDHVETALLESKIPCTVVRHPNQAGAQIAKFRTEQQDTVIVLDASSETAAGSNLQCANHVIFLSPLLRDTSYGYDSKMAQAVGRARRHGQKKAVYVYRIVALDTIDVDIVEHRERRVNALTEQGYPEIIPPPAARELDMRDHIEEEKTQLVRDENGRFSLRPQSWLVKCGEDGDAEEMARAKGRNRVAGWEDFSSLIKFSKAFNEDDS